MAKIAKEYLEHQRRRWMRPNAHLYIQHDACRFMPPGSPFYSGRDVVKYFWPEADAPQPDASTTDSDPVSDDELASQRLALARLRVDWELLKFELRGRKAGFNPDQPRDEDGKWMDAGGSGTDGNPDSDGEIGSDETVDFDADGGEGRVIEVSSKLPQIVKEYGKLTARQYVSRYCRGSVNRELPGEFEDMTIADIWNIARGGDARARTCLKLMRPRFEK